MSRKQNGKHMRAKGLNRCRQSKAATRSQRRRKLKEKTRSRTTNPMISKPLTNLLPFIVDAARDVTITQVQVGQVGIRTQQTVDILRLLECFNIWIQKETAFLNLKACLEYLPWFQIQTYWLKRRVTTFLLGEKMANPKHIPRCFYLFKQPS